MARQVYDPEDLKQAEEKPYRSKALNSSSTTPGKIRYSSDSSKEQSSDDLSTSTTDDDIRYDSTEDIPENESSMYNASPTIAGRVRYKNYVKTRKKRFIAGGGIAGLIVASVIMIISLGPFQLIHASQILQKPFSKNNSDSSTRLRRLFRAARANDIGETRVGRLGSSIFGKTIKQLSDIGIEVERGPTGAPTKFTVDTEKLKSAYPEIDNMSPEDRRSFIAEKLGLTSADLKPNGTLYSIDSSEFDIKTSRALTKGTVGLLDDGKIVSGIKSRVLTKFFNLPSLFHPFKRAVADKENTILNSAQKKAQEAQDEKAREASVTDPAEERGVAAVKDVQDESAKYNSTVMKALLFTAGACFIRSVSGEVIKINYDLVALPSSLRAVDVIAAGEQARSGKDLSPSQAGSLVDNFTDENGKTIWQGQAMQALASGKTDPSLTDIPPDLRQAFSVDTTAAQIKDWANRALGGRVTGAIICSPGGQLVQIAASLFLAASSAFAEVGSAGTLTPVIVGGWVAREGLSFTVSAVGMHFLEKFILGKSTAKLAENAFSGPVGGDLLAYGSRVASNSVAIASGGLALGNKASTLIAQQQEITDAKQYKSMSIAQRLFDPYDYRSAISKLIDNTGTSPYKDTVNVANAFTRFGSVISQSLSWLTPRAHAANATYDWGFPQYGLPDSMLNDPNMDDPYANADYVAKLFDSGTTYQDKALACFGVTISKSSGVWDVVPTNDVNPQDDPYQSNDCNSSDENWHRVSMFVFDTETMKAAACYQGDEQSCIDLGQDSSGTSNPTGNPPSGTGGTVDEGSNSQLAQKLLDYQKTGQYHCDNPGDCTDLQKIVNGQSLAGSDGCQASTLDPRVLQLLLYIIENGGFKIGTFALCGDHHYDGQGGHSGGLAVDMSTVNGASLAQDTQQAGTEGLKLDKFLNSLPSNIKLDQQISYGYGGHYFQPMASTQQYGGKLCNSTCVSIYTLDVENQHTNHIHAGF